MLTPIRVAAMLTLLLSVLLAIGFVATALIAPEAADKLTVWLSHVIRTSSGIHVEAKTAPLLPFALVIISGVVLFLTAGPIGNGPSRVPKPKKGPTPIDHSDRSVSQ